MSRRVIYPYIKTANFGIERPFPGDYSNDDIESAPSWVISDYVGSASENDLPNYVKESQTYFNANETLSMGGQELQGVNNFYYANANVDIELQAEIVDAQGDVQTQIDSAALQLPPVLKMPIVKFAGEVGIDRRIVDEVYFNVTLTAGVMTATGQIPNSGDWKLLADRVNASIAAIGQTWKVERPNITFLV